MGISLINGPGFDRINGLRHIEIAQLGNGVEITNQTGD
jgi:hypothetical protein